MVGLVMNNTHSGTNVVTEATPSGGDSNDKSDKTTTHVSAGLVGALVLVLVLVVIIVIRRRMHRHRDSKDSDESEAEMDSLNGVAVYRDSNRPRNDGNDIIMTRDGRKLSRRKLIESLWVEDEDLRSVMKRYTIQSNKIQLGRLLGKGNCH